MKAAFDHRPRSNRLTGYSLSPPAILFSFSFSFSSPRSTMCSFSSLPLSLSPSLFLSLSSCRRKHSRTVPTNHFSPKPRLSSEFATGETTSSLVSSTPRARRSRTRWTSLEFSNPSKDSANSHLFFLFSLSTKLSLLLRSITAKYDRSYSRALSRSSRREARRCRRDRIPRETGTPPVYLHPRREARGSKSRVRLQGVTLGRSLEPPRSSGLRVLPRRARMLPPKLTLAATGEGCPVILAVACVAAPASIRVEPSSILRGEGWPRASSPPTIFSTSHTCEQSDTQLGRGTLPKLRKLFSN